MGLFKDVFAVILDGNKIVKLDKSWFSCLRQCVQCSKDHSVYVELWYYYDSVNRTLLRYWN